MNQKLIYTILITALVHLLTPQQVSAQIKDFKQAKFTVSPDSCFTKALTFLEGHNYFIEALDRSGGYIKAKSYTKNNKVLSSKVGEKRTISFLFKPTSNGTLVSINIYAETLSWVGSTQNRVLSLEDNGILEDPSAYKQIIDALKNELR